MQFFTIASILASVAVVLALPNSGGEGDGNGVLCHSSTFPNPVCCSTDVLGVADLDCTPPSPVPHSIPQFKSTCAAGGKTAKCCLIPVAGQAVLCEDPL